ncbi:MAG: TatD family hydrolase [Bacteroidetes bacterium]|nr:TatD family hydrolase [Bacteroidota bacterium]
MYIDVHTHLAKYDEQLPDALEEIKKNNILTVSVSMDDFLFEKNLRIAKTNDLIIPSFGIHPWSATRYSYKLGELVDAIDKSAMIGEIGLDFHFIEDTEQYPHQKKVFEFLLETAKHQNKIINVHSKGAEKEVLEYLKFFGIERAIIHWYSGPMKYVKKFLDLGCCFSIGVEILESNYIRKLLFKIPEDRLLTETDNPGGYEWLKQSKGMPSLIINVVEKIAEIKLISVDEVMNLVQKNFYNLLENDPHIDQSVKNMLSGRLY